MCFDMVTCKQNMEKWHIYVADGFKVDKKLKSIDTLQKKLKQNLILQIMIKLDSLLKKKNTKKLSDY